MCGKGKGIAKGTRGWPRILDFILAPSSFSNQGWTEGRIGRIGHKNLMIRHNRSARSNFTRSSPKKATHQIIHRPRLLANFRLSSTNLNRPTSKVCSPLICREYRILMSIRRANLHPEWPEGELSHVLIKDRKGRIRH